MSKYVGMKKITTVVTILIGITLNAQWMSSGSSITTTNNVGIGTSTPSGKLEILHDANLSSSITLPNSGLVIRADNDGNDASLRFGLDNANLKALIQTQQTTTAAKFDLLINPFGGNVGIGTINPSMKLQIAGSAASGYNNTLSLNNNEWFNFGNVSGYGFINWFSQANTGRDDFVNTHSSVKASSIRGGNGEIKFYTSSANNGIGQSSELTERMTIESNGNVGIGTTSPDAKLAVNGNIHTKEVKVDLVGWPDYVFEEEYHLPTLQEVETHIEEKGHLQNIPSAKKVEENGIKLGEMNSKLLQKIEELMLYTIQQQKEIEELKNEISELKKVKE